MFNLKRDRGRTSSAEQHNEKGRPRAHSAPTVSLYGINPQSHNLAGLPGLSVRDHQLRTMHNGTGTTVPQNLTPPDLSCSRTPQRRRPRGRMRQFSIQSRRESFEMRCCRINVLLVVMQLCLGVVNMALGFYMQTLTPTLQTRECPFWAGVPLLLAGVVGIYFCLTDFAAYAGSLKAFIVKAICFTLSTICIFLCMVAAVFPGIHGRRISTYHECKLDKISATVTNCNCLESTDKEARTYVYEKVNCDTVVTSVKDYLILECAFNSIASGVCFWFVTLLWKSRYQDFYAGLRFYSYSASIPDHP